MHPYSFFLRKAISHTEKISLVFKITFLIHLNSMITKIGEVFGFEYVTILERELINKIIFISCKPSFTEVKYYFSCT